MEGALRILVVRLGAMGDVIHALPAVAALRASMPSAVIAWAIEERWAELLSTNRARSAGRSPEKPLVDLVHGVNTKGWRAALFSDETWKEALATIGELRAAGYHMAVDFQGALKAALLAQLSGAPRRFGFAQPREKPATLFYTRQVVPRGKHIIEQNLELAGGAGAAATSIVFPLPCDPMAEEFVTHQLRQRGIGQFVLLNPGAGWGAKCWPAERYGAVAHALAREGLASVVNFGPGEEALARSVEQASEGAATALLCTIGELVALTRRARIFVGGDTGPMHLAAALGVPVVAIFGPTDPARNGPYGVPQITLRSATSRTTYSHRAQSDEGVLQISSEQVIAGAQQLLSRGRLG
jgi:heptosyltransferase-1